MRLRYDTLHEARGRRRCSVPASAPDTGPTRNCRDSSTLLDFRSPVAFVQDPTDRAVQFVVQQADVSASCAAATILAGDFLNLTGSVSCCGERGLLGLAFAPDYASSGRFYVNFTNSVGDTVVARFTRSAESDSSPMLRRRFDLLLDGTRAIHQPAVFQSQWRAPRVRSRWLSLHRAWRRRLRQRSRPSRAEPERTARQDAAHRRQRAR